MFETQLPPKFSLGGFSCDLTIKNLKLKNSLGHGPGKKNLQQKQSEYDLSMISPNLEENTKKIEKSEILSSNIETSKSDPTNDQKRIQNLQTTSTENNVKGLSPNLDGNSKLKIQKSRISTTKHLNRTQRITGKKYKTSRQHLLTAILIFLQRSHHLEWEKNYFKKFGKIFRNRRQNKKNV